MIILISNLYINLPNNVVDNKYRKTKKTIDHKTNLYFTCNLIIQGIIFDLNIGAYVSYENLVKILEIIIFELF